MKTQYIYIEKLLYAIGLLLILFGMAACEEENFSIVPDAIETQTITSIEPSMADVGTTITITGTNFSQVPANNKVSFGSTPAEVLSATETTLTVVVPEGATTGPISIFKVETVEGPLFTVVPAPVINEFSVTGAAVGTSITISGANFGATAGENIVRFNGVTADITSASTTELVVVVPEEATTGPITVEVIGQTNETELIFTIAPVIEAINPEVGLPGETVTITGSNFNAVPDNNNVSFNGALAIVESASTTELVVTVPDDATTGPVAVEIETLLATSPTDFTIDSTTLIFAINDINDDVEEAADGRMTLDSSDLELGEFDTFGTPDVGLQKIGLRFNGVNIPSGVTITAASIQFVADQTAGADPTEMTIFGENVGNAAAYVEVDNDLSNRALTTANAIWNIPEWTGTETGPNQRTVDISDIIQEIIARGDWAEGNSMNFIFEATGVSAGATENNVGREAETYDVDNPQEGAQLIITFID